MAALLAQHRMQLDLGWRGARTGRVRVGGAAEGAPPLPAGACVLAVVRWEDALVLPCEPCGVWWLPMASVLVHEAWLAQLLPSFVLSGAQLLSGLSGWGAPSRAPCLGAWCPPPPPLMWNVRPPHPRKPAQIWFPHSSPAQDNSDATPSHPRVAEQDVAN